MVCGVHSQVMDRCQESVSGDWKGTCRMEGQVGYSSYRLKIRLAVFLLLE